MAEPTDGHIRHQLRLQRTQTSGNAHVRTDRIIVTDAAELDALWTRSELEPVVLFNYDPGCGGNARARREMDTVTGTVGIIDVHQFHGLGQEVARRTGVRHESPQVFVLRGGQVKWTAHHREISAAAIQRAIEALVT